MFDFFLFLDPFADAIKGTDDDVQDGLVHIRIQQRNGRKTLTTVQGLSANYDLKKIVRSCKKVRREFLLFVYTQLIDLCFCFLGICVQWHSN